MEEPTARQLAKMILLLDLLRDELYEQLLNRNGIQGQMILRDLQNGHY